MSASASAGSHCHGYWFVKAARRRTSSILGPIVLSFKNGHAAAWPTPPASPTLEGCTTPSAR
jgi:hypothetical protein